MIPNSMMVRDMYDASEERPHSIRVIVNGYEVPVVKASAIGRWAELLDVENNKVLRLENVTVEYLWGSPLTSMDGAIAAFKFLTDDGPDPYPKLVRRWASYAKA
jgi:hypothetical protein